MTWRRAVSATVRVETDRGEQKSERKLRKRREHVKASLLKTFGFGEEQSNRAAAGKRAENQWIAFFVAVF